MTLNEGISCIIPTFNRANVLEEAIRSIINQTYTNWELLIVNDGSSDNTKDIINDFMAMDERIRYLENPSKGGNSARNFGILNAKNEWVTFLDDDDISLPNRFLSQLTVAKKTGSEFVSSYYYTSNTRNSSKLNGIDKKNILYGVGDGIPSRWLIKKGLLEKVGGFDERQIAMQDNEVSFRLAKYESYLIHKEYVSIVYTTDNSVSRNIEKALKGKIQLIEKHSDKMHPFELSAWFYTISNNYLQVGNQELSNDFLVKCLALDRYGYFRKIEKFKKYLKIFGLEHNKRFYTRMLNMFKKYFISYPYIVKHAESF